MARPENFDIDLLIDYLRGTANHIEQALESLMDEKYGGVEMVFEDLTSADLDRLDSEIFSCTCCGWWCDISEMSERADVDWYCRDCEDEM